MPWPLDTTLPTPGACVAAFLGAYSQGNPAKTWLTDTNPFRRVWKCGADAHTYNEPWVTTNHTDMISAFNYTGVFEEDEYISVSSNPKHWYWGEFEPYWIKYGKSRLWRHLNLYGMIAPWRRTSKRWYPTDEYREENYDMRGNVTMVFRAGHMRGPEWSSSETEEMNGNDPHAPCLCEYTSPGNATEDTTTGHEELQDLLKRAECAIGNLNWRCGLPPPPRSKRSQRACSIARGAYALPESSKGLCSSTVDLEGSTIEQLHFDNIRREPPGGHQITYPTVCHGLHRRLCKPRVDR